MRRRNQDISALVCQMLCGELYGYMKKRADGHGGDIGRCLPGEERK